MFKKLIAMTAIFLAVSTLSFGITYEQFKQLKNAGEVDHFYVNDMRVSVVGIFGINKDNGEILTSLAHISPNDELLGYLFLKNDQVFFATYDNEADTYVPRHFTKQPHADILKKVLKKWDDIIKKQFIPNTFEKM